MARNGIAALTAAACLTGVLASQGQVRVVDDGPHHYGAAWLFDLNADGTIDSLSEVPTPDPVSDNDAFGSGLAPLGDLNGDGNQDLAAGSPGDDRSGANRGALWILFRDADGGLASRLALRPDRNFPGSALPENGRFGSALASLGDLDGDGTLELAVGTNTDGPLGLHGTLRIFSLRTDGTVASEHEIGAGLLQFGLFQNGFFGESLFGGSLASLGDFDNDGVTDLLVGTTGDNDGGAPFSGAAWILLLNADATIKTAQKISNTSGGLGGVLDSNDLFGESVAVLGDLNSDGVTDVAVGATGDDDGSAAAGAVWVLLLNPDGTVLAEQKISKTQGGLGSHSSSLFGSALAPVGDLDSDGIPDLAAGARAAVFHATSPGAVFVLFLNADGTVRSRVDLAPTFPGLVNGDSLGASLASVGDWDGDGRPDLIVGAGNRDGAPTSPDSSDVPSAIAASASGDTILIRGGTYGGTSVVNAKSITIQALNPGNVALTGTMKVSNLSTAQAVRLGGLVVEADATLPQLRLENNGGRVWVDDCRFGFTLPLPFSSRPSTGMSVHACAAVILNRTQVIGVAGDPPDWSNPAPARTGLELDGGSQLHAYDCTFTGADGRDGLTIDDVEVQQRGGPGILSASAGDFLFLSGCAVQGGDSETEFGSLCEPGAVGFVTSGPARVLDSTIAGGQGCPDGAAHTGPVESLDGDALSMFVNNPTRSGEGTLFTFEGPPGAAVSVLFSFTAGARYRPALQGTDLLGAQRFLDFMGRTEADGRLQVTRSLGVLPPGDVVRLFAQSFYTQPSAANFTHKASPSPRPIQLGTGAMLIRLGTP